MAAAAERAAFRSVLRLCRDLDRRPGFLAALLGRPPRRYHPGLRKLVRVPPSRWPFVDDAIWEVLGRSSEYAHPASRSCSAAARSHRLRTAMLGISYVPEAQEFKQRVQAASDFVASVIDDKNGGAVEEAELPSSLQLERAQGSDPVEVGDILVTHPLSCLFQPELDQAILVIEEVDEESGAVHGLALNKADGVTLKEALAMNPTQAEDHLEPLLEAPLHIGGDLVLQDEKLLDRVQWIHGLGERLPGSRQLLPGVHVGGCLNEAAELVRSGEVDPSTLRPVLGFAGWDHTQLELELERGVWVRARARDGSCCGALLSQGDDAAWRSALSAAGMPALAAFPRGHAADHKLREWVEAHAQAQVQEMLG